MSLQGMQGPILIKFGKNRIQILVMRVFGSIGKKHRYPQANMFNEACSNVIK